MTNKMTNKVALEIAIESVKALGNMEAVEKLEKMLAQVEKRANAEKKLSANQKENLDTTDKILAFMEVGNKYTITDIMKNCDAVADMSNQKVSALLRQLKLDGKVTREEIKRKAYFSLALEV